MSSDVAVRRQYGQPDDNPDFIHQERQERYRWADLALTLGVFLMPFGALMDWNIYREQFAVLAVGRVLVTLVLLVGLATRRFWASGKWFEPVSFALILSPGLFFCWMMYHTNGSQSLYYFGLILLMIIVQMLGFRATQSALYCGVSTFAYMLAVIAANDFRFTMNAEFAQGLFFLTVCSVASVAVCATYRRNRFEAFCLNRDLALEQKLLRQTEQRLVHSEKMRAIAGVAAGLIHEINNPVNYSLMATTVLKRKFIEGSEEREMVDDVEAGVTRIGEIISTLRTFAHPEQLGNPTSFRIRDAITTSVRFLTHELPAGRVLLDESTPLDTKVLGSESQIVQVLLNLILNAEKAIRAAYPKELKGDWRESSDELDNHIRVSVAMREGRLAVSVSDNGVGMTDAEAQMVREPFFTSRSGEGLGLGLGICETILRAHDGAIEIESQLGEGTVVTFDLALSHNAESETKDVASSSSPYIEAG
ncbi:MAG: HAMP domain-containing sensor histidine kinase [Planctomycetota bacterium]